MTHKTKQTGNIVSGGGQVAGGDIISHNYRTRRSLLHKLHDEYEKETEADRNFQETIDSLQIYLDSVDTDDREDLTTKLKAAGRDPNTEILFALKLKELFAKKLARLRLSQAAQRIYALVLGRVHVLFCTHVAPLIEAGAKNSEIDSVLLESVIEKMFHELDENTLVIDYQELRGIVYFLTGNCHIRWV